MWRRAGDKFGTRHSLNEERKTEETQPDYGGQDGRLWRSVEMRARDTARGEDARLWRRREGKTGKEGLRGGENR